MASGAGATSRCNRPFALTRAALTRANPGLSAGCVLAPVSDRASLRRACYGCTGRAVTGLFGR